MILPVLARASTACRLEVDHARLLYKNLNYMELGRSSPDPHKALGADRGREQPSQSILLQSSLVRGLRVEQD